MFLPAFFFFSSRRRHTRFDCDWSSDVCSSDLPVVHVPNRAHVHMRLRAFKFRFCHGTLKKNKCVSQNRDVSARRLGATSFLDASFPFKLATGIEPVTSSLPRTRSTG